MHRHHTQFTPPKGIVNCDHCGQFQPISATVSYLDGQICTVCKPHVAAQLDAEQQLHDSLTEEAKASS